MTIGVIAAVAEFEWDFLMLRTQAGLSRTVSQGKSLVRPSDLNKTRSKGVLKRLAEGDAVALIAREYGCSRQSIIGVRGEG